MNDKSLTSIFMILYPKGALTDLKFGEMSWLICVSCHHDTPYENTDWCLHKNRIEISQSIRIFAEP